MRRGGADGLVSLEVSPELAHDTDGTVAEAKRLWSALDRPNAMIKIPGTKAGLPAIEASLAAGISINVTLLFSVARYDEVIEAFLKGLERRRAQGQPIDRITSVASFFVSRVDGQIDPLLDKAGDPQKLRGTIAIANAGLAYAAFERSRATPRWQALAAAGARAQRPLWASTSTKDPKYPDVYYIEALIAADTVNTIPPDTFDAYRDHGKPEPRIAAGHRDGAATARGAGRDGHRSRRGHPLPRGGRRDEVRGVLPTAARGNRREGARPGRTVSYGHARCAEEDLADAVDHHRDDPGCRGRLARSRRLDPDQRRRDRSSRSRTSSSG